MPKDKIQSHINIEESQQQPFDIQQFALLRDLSVSVRDSACRGHE